MSGTKPIVVFSGPGHSAEVARRVLEPDFEVVAVRPEPESLLPAFSQCAAFLDASMKVPLSSEVIMDAARLKVVVAATTGATHIDQSALKERGIPLLTLKGQTEILRELTPAAELSWALVMACARRLRGAILHVASAAWDRTEFPGVMLKGRTIGLIGMGRIGTWMARYAHAFGMNIQYFDPYEESAPEYAKRVSLEELVSSSDVVSIHVHVNEETTGMISRELIQTFKHGSIFINTARGELTDEFALVEALETGRLAALGVDVLLGEPDIRNNPIWEYAKSHENVVITPHIGGFCPDAVDKVVEFSAVRIRQYLESI